MKKLLLAMTLTLPLMASSCPEDTPGATGVAFCTAVADAVSKLTILRNTGQLGPNAIRGVDASIATINPYCSAPGPTAPSTAIVAAADALFFILAQETGS